MSSKKRILWADDEIDILKPYTIFLQDKYDLTTVSNGADALVRFEQENFDLVILDEHMPGLSGVDVLNRIKANRPEMSVVMMTKSEDEGLMASALGRLVDDYLVKPVSIPQMAVCLKKIFDKVDLVRKEAQEQFLREYGRMSSDISLCQTWAEWAALYHKMVTLELRLVDSDNSDIAESLLSLKSDANIAFAKFVARNYDGWVSGGTAAGGPLMSHRVLSERVKPLLQQKKKVALVVIDNFRLDQWEVIRPLLSQDFEVSTELYSAILPTATQFARNSIFSGLLPADIKKMLPQFWTEGLDEDSLNQHERELLANYFERQKMNVRNAYYKVGFAESGENIIKKFGGYVANDLNALVYNFVDMLSHACTDNKTLQEIIPDDAAYRAITRQWFANGTLREMLGVLRKHGFTILLTTDHGAIRVRKALEVKGLKDMTTNLRFKTGKSVTYNAKEVFEVLRPLSVGLPEVMPGAPYIFAPADRFFVYPNNRNDYMARYEDSFQHGGVSMEEMILPFVTLVGK